MGTFAKIIGAIFLYLVFVAGVAQALHNPPDPCAPSAEARQEWC